MRRRCHQFFKKPSADAQIAPSGRYDLKVFYTTALNEGRAFDVDPRGK